MLKFSNQSRWGYQEIKPVRSVVNTCSAAATMKSRRGSRGLPSNKHAIRTSSRDRASAKSRKSGSVCRNRESAEGGWLSNNDCQSCAISPSSTSAEAARQVLFQNRKPRIPGRLGRPASRRMRNRNAMWAIQSHELSKRSWAILLTERDAHSEILAIALETQ